MAREQDRIDRCINALRFQTPEAWAAIKHDDACWLAHLFVRARRMVLEGRDESEEICRECLGYTWGRPQRPDMNGMDFTRRVCSECGLVRDEPPEGTEL